MFKFLKSRARNDGGVEKLRARHGSSVGEPDGCHFASHIVHGLRQIVECIFISTGSSTARAVDKLMFTAAAIKAGSSRHH